MHLGHWEVHMEFVNNCSVSWHCCRKGDFWEWELEMHEKQGQAVAVERRFVEGRADKALQQSLLCQLPRVSSADL